MTVYVEPPEVVPGQVMSAANWGDWVVDVAKAMWVYTAAGQVPYSTASNQLAALSKPSVASLLWNDNAGIPAWLALTDLLHITKRQGGNASNWAVNGTTNYDVTLPKIRVGTTRISISSGYGTSVAVTFNSAFSQVPIVFLTKTYHGQTVNDFGIVSISTTGFTVSITHASLVTLNIDIYWIAIGT